MKDQQWYNILFPKAFLEVEYLLKVLW